MNSFQITRYFRENQRAALENCLLATIQEREQMLVLKGPRPERRDEIRRLDRAIRTMRSGLSALGEQHSPGQSSFSTIFDEDASASENR
jgi:hypothetical protein